MSERIPGDGNVRIEMNGLMVGRYDETKKTYEVGILPAPVHALSISVVETMPGGATRELWTLPIDEIPAHHRTWQLEIKDRNPDANLFHFSDPGAGNGLFNRTVKPDDDMPEEKRKDFRWVIDLENNFPEHGSTLQIRKEVLWPIIYIKNGLFYTHLSEGITTGFQKLQFKSGLLTGFEEFGYASDVVAVDLGVLPEDEEVILRVAPESEDGPPGADIYRLVVMPGSKYVIKIENMPTHREHVFKGNERSHFQFYYMLFDVLGSKWYDFAGIVESGVIHPHHDIAADIAEGDTGDDGGLGTPNPFKCSIGHLGNRTEPLD